MLAEGIKDPELAEDLSCGLLPYPTEPRDHVDVLPDLLPMGYYSLSHVEDGA